MALRLSLANSPGVFQGDSPNWSEKGNSVANSSKDFSGVLKVDEADFFLLGVFGNKRFPFDSALKENLGFSAFRSLGRLLNSRCHGCLWYVRGRGFPFYTLLNLSNITHKLLHGTHR